jgi:hypothetical protein
VSGLALARPPRRLTTLAVALSAIAGALASLAVMSLVSPAGHAGSAASSHTAPGRAFTVSVPAGWRALSSSELAAIPARPAAVLRRGDGHGLVVIRRTAPVRATGARLVHDLGSRLRNRFPGFRVVNARFTRVRGGRAFVYTFERDPSRTAQTVALASVNGKAYEIDAVVPSGAPGAARDAGAIVASFGP